MSEHSSLHIQDHLSILPKCHMHPIPAQPPQAPVHPWFPLAGGSSYTPLLPPLLPSRGKSPRGRRGAGDGCPSPTYLDDAAPARQAARLALPGEGAGGRAGGRGERGAAGAPGGAGLGFVRGYAEAAVSVGNPGAVIARPPVAEAPSAAAAFPRPRLSGRPWPRGPGPGRWAGPRRRRPPGRTPPWAPRDPPAQSRVPASPRPRRLGPRGPSSSPPPAAASAASSAFFFTSYISLIPPN